MAPLQAAFTIMRRQRCVPGEGIRPRKLPVHHRLALRIAVGALQPVPRGGMHCMQHPVRLLGGTLRPVDQLPGAPEAVCRVIAMNRLRIKPQILFRFHLCPLPLVHDPAPEATGISTLTAGAKPPRAPRIHVRRPHPSPHSGAATWSWCPPQSGSVPWDGRASRGSTA